MSGSRLTAGPADTFSATVDPLLAPVPAEVLVNDRCCPFAR
jgi:hypothetical protein